MAFFVKAIPGCRIKNVHLKKRLLKEVLDKIELVVVLKSPYIRKCFDNILCYFPLPSRVHAWMNFMSKLKMLKTCFHTRPNYSLSFKYGDIK